MIDMGNREIDPSNEPSLEPLDKWLEDLIDKTGRIIEVRYGEQVDTPSGAMLRQLKERASALSCLNCAGERRRICRGALRDNATVTSRGHCFKQVKETFSIAVKISEEYYRYYARGFVTSPDIQLSTSEASGKPHDIPADIFVGASTTYHDTEATGPISSIELKIAIKLLDWKSWLAVLYVFFHELICHAYAGSAPPHSGRDELRSFDPFAEGWMDRICSMMLQDVMNGTAPAFPTAAALSFRAGHTKFGQEFSHHQEALPRENGGKAYSVVQSVRAADFVYFALQKLLPPTAAREALYRISLEFNLQRRAVTARSHIIAVIIRDLVGPQSSGYGWLVRLLNQYVRDKRDAISLFNELLRL
jgi:hypothetical protein